MAAIRLFLGHKSTRMRGEDGGKEEENERTREVCVCVRGERERRRWLRG